MDLVSIPRVSLVISEIYRQAKWLGIRGKKAILHLQRFAVSLDFWLPFRQGKGKVLSRPEREEALGIKGRGGFLPGKLFQHIHDFLYVKELFFFGSMYNDIGMK
jgi:hypothetical protein